MGGPDEPGHDVPVSPDQALTERPLQALKFSFRPGRGQRHLSSFPVPEAVIHAVRMSGPPKQMLVISGSGKAVCSVPPAGSKAVIPPFTRVAQQTLPEASTARLSSSW